MVETKVISVEKEIRKLRACNELENHETETNYYKVILSCKNENSNVRYSGILSEDLVPKPGDTLEMKKCQPMVFLPNRLSDEKEGEYLFRIKN